MKNPLTSIRGYLELLMDEPKEKLSDDLRKHVRNSYESSGRLLDKVRDLLDISKMEEGKLVPGTDTLDLAALVDSAHVEQSVLAKKSNKTIELDVRPDLPAVKGDPDLIGRVLTNLLSNSVKHTPKGAVIKLFAWPAAAHPHAPADAAVLIGISDNGEGIPKEYHEKIFEKFGTVELRKGGAPKLSTGLGLTFCRMAVEAHGGKLWLESEAGKGATFYFCLPPAPRRASQPTQPSPLRPGAGFPEPASSGIIGKA
jgi:signal transduction histidine kinase